MSDIEGRPLISTDDNAPKKPKPKSGCLAKLCSFCIWIFLICFVITKFNSCRKSDIEVKPQQQTQPSAQAEVVTPKPDSTSGEGEDKNENLDDNLTLSDKASGVEKRYFHKFYTDMGTVEIHHFKERKKTT